jgi:hypothetical protein
MSKSNWTSKQIEAMMEFAEAGISIEDTSSAMIATGWEKRTVPSIRSKYRSYTGSNWPMKIDLTVEDEMPDVEEHIPVNIESPGIDWMPIIMIGIGALIMGYYWWSY